MDRSKHTRATEEESVAEAAGSPPSLHFPPAACLAALLAGAAGAGAWAALLGNTGYEVGYVSSGVGVLVGFAAARLGARGGGAGALCALVALAAIFGGKMLGASWQVAALREEASAKYLTPDVYESFREDAQYWANIDRENDLLVRDFMVLRGYAVQPVSADALADFRGERASRLDWMIREQPDFDRWKARLLDNFGSATVSAVAETLDWRDLVFALLGVSAAFAIVARR